MSGKPIWPKIPAPFVRAMLAGHSALGLAFAALIYVVCLTGTLAVVSHEFQRWERPNLAPIDAPSASVVERAVRDAVARHPGLEHLYVNLPDKEFPRLTLYVDTPGEDDPSYYADASGALVSDAHAAWSDFLLNMHINLHLPRSWGIFLVGATGVALLSSLISGLFAHPRIFRDAFQLRWGGDKRLQEADLHNRIGVWGLPFHIIISLTGALLGLTTVIVGFLAFALFQGDMERAYALFLPPEPIENHAPASLPALAPMFDVVAREGFGVSQVFYEHPGTQGQGVLVYTTTPPGVLSNGSLFAFDGAGALLHKQILATSSLGTQMLQAVSVLHFGWFGGWPIKLAYVLLGAGLTIVTTSGVAIWLARRRAKGRPAPAWERIWIASVWSLPAALALCALVALLAPGAPLLAFWAAFVAAALLLTLLWTPAQLSAGLRTLTAATLLALPVAHVVLFGMTPRDPVALGVNAALLALGLCVAATLAPRRARQERKIEALSAQEP